MRLSQFLPGLNRKTGPLLDCNDTLIDGAVNEMFGRFVSCQPGFDLIDWQHPLGNPTHHRPKPHSCQVSRRTMTSKYSRKISINFNCICVKLICTEISEEVLNHMISLQTCIK